MSSVLLSVQLRFFVVLTTFLPINTLFSQGCDYPTMDELGAEYHISFDPTQSVFGAEEESNGEGENITKTYLIRVIVIRDDSGSAPLGPDYSTLVHDVNEANKYFEPFDMEFRVSCQPLYMDSSQLLWGLNAFYDFLQESEDVGFIDIYSSQGLTTYSALASYPGQANFIFIKQSSPEVVAHELGHFFGLKHTFHPTNPAELVNGSNCSVAGDGICDTPADPYPNGSFDPQSCSYTDTVLTDANGDLYAPNMDNLMSYFNCSGQPDFTTQQAALMSWVSDNERFHYIDDTTALTVTEFPRRLCHYDSSLHELKASWANAVFSGPGVSNNMLDASQLSQGTYTITVTIPGTPSFDSTLIYDAGQISYNYADTVDTNYAWQSYEAKRNGIIEIVHFRLESNASTNVNLKIYAGIGTSGSVLYNGSYNIPYTTMQWVDFPLSNGVSQIAGQHYTIELQSTVGNLGIILKNPFTSSSIQTASSMSVGSIDYSWGYLVGCKTDVHHCTSMEIEVTRDPKPNLSFIPDIRPRHCINDAPVKTIGSFTAYYLDSAYINGVKQEYFDPQAYGVGTHSITYFETNNYGCFVQYDTVVEVVGYPVLNIDTLHCIDDSAVDYHDTYPNGDFWINGSHSSVFDPGVYGVGSHTIELRIPNAIDSVTYQQNNIPFWSSLTNIALISGDYLAQSFVLDTNINLRELKTFVNSQINSTNTLFVSLLVEIRSGTGVSGPVVFSKSINVPSNFGTIDIIDSSQVNIYLYDSEPYTIIIKRTDNVAANSVSFNIENSGNGYAGGTLIQNGTPNPQLDLGYTMIGFALSHCGEFQTLAVNVTDDAPPLNLPNEVADCDSVVLDAGQAQEYMWSDNSTNQTLTVFSSGQYWVQASNGCWSFDSSMVTIHPPAQLTNIYGELFTKPDTSYAYHVDSTIGSSYAWSTIDGTILNGQGSPSVTVLWDTSGIDNISVIETTVNGCYSEGVEIVVGIEEPNGFSTPEQTLISIYPNPTSGELMVRSSNPSISSIEFEIYDMLGKVVDQGRVKVGQTIDINSHAQGAYSLKINGSDPILIPFMIVH